jgi:hypothetical protein
MTIENFEKELQDIHKEFRIIKGQQSSLATVFFATEPLFSIPRDVIYDEVNPKYGIELPSGKFQRHRTRTEAYGMAQAMFQRMKTDPDYADAMMGTGAYSDANLK